MRSLKNWINNNITLHSHDNPKEEFLNGLTHFIGIILSVIGIVLIIIKDTTVTLKIASIVYGFTMLLLFTASTVYHWIKTPFYKRIARIMDHCNIYLLIAGTYTPVAFFVGGSAGITIIWIEWILTLLGIAFTIKFWGRLKPLHVVFYLAMGWMLVIIWNDFINSVSMEFAKMIIIGGITYTLGVVVYGLKKIPFYHAVWHLFVVAGATFMFLGVYNHLI